MWTAIQILSQQTTCKQSTAVAELIIIWKKMIEIKRIYLKAAHQTRAPGLQLLGQKGKILKTLSLIFFILFTQFGQINKLTIIKIKNARQKQNL